METVVIIGGGASGMMAALTAAEDGSRRVVLLERQARDAERQRKKMIEVQDVSMRFRLTDDKIMSLKEFVTRKLSGKLKTNEFWALKHVSFDVYKGEVMGIIGDIKGKTCIINDDMIDTAGTLCANVKELKAMGAGDIYVCATHGIFSGPAIERLNDAPIVECVVTDAIPVEVGGKIKTISVAEEFAQAISAVYHEEPVSTLVGGDFAL